MLLILCLLAYIYTLYLILPHPGQSTRAALPPNRPLAQGLWEATGLALHPEGPARPVWP